ncbi:hypothetical protein SAMN05661096_00364 [Marivirga sericea]|uniref:Uncharacterized protein n=1 Tax=Marivirga sericea TaxID=1028 RepID=A0A1X7I984_9BACT|nr:hypothetical protein [Marivirga sericea]SMG10941.1 hypothetical protein SAMN05661096_00364 [Marivirga sericea]
MLPAQIVQGDGSTSDESELYASTKQVNQFFRRFNGEEDQKGNRFYENDKSFRETSLRKDYITLLFDRENQNISIDQKKSFINDVTDKRNPQFLDFHREGWFAEVNAVFNRDGQQENILLFFKIQQEGKGYEWVLEQVASSYYQEFFDKDEGDEKAFLHPMSHELDFMNLHKSLNQENAVDFTGDDFEVDPLSIFLYEMASKQLQFKTVKNSRFHFFQCEGWYFQITEYNRSGYNSGWLISDLTKLQRQDIPKLKAFIYEAK